MVGLQTESFWIQHILLKFGRPKGVMARGLTDPLAALVDDISASPST